MTRGKSAAKPCDHPTYPEYKEEFGEDPARILYHLDPRPRIRSIKDPDLLRAYLTVEAERDNPRRVVVAACNAQLEDVDAAAADGPLQATVATDGGEQR